MNKAVHFLIILSILFCPFSPAQTVLSTKNPGSNDLSAPASAPYGTGSYEQSFESDPQYYISLRWLVYMLILSLPIAPVQAPPLQTTATEKTNL